MIAVDTHILVYAHRQDSPFHEQAYDRIKALAEGPDPWAVPWPCVHEFYAIVTHPRIYAPPSTAAQAIGQLDAWLAAPGLTLLAESTLHWAALKPMLTAARIAGAQVHDARIAALCLQHGIQELWTADRDFSRYPALKTINPLVA